MNPLKKLIKFIFRLSNSVMIRIRRYYHLLFLGQLGKKSYIMKCVIMSHPDNIFIGNNTTINEHAIIQASKDAKVMIGDNVSISFGAIILTASRRKIDIGLFERYHVHKTVVIGNGAWIAANATILPGVTIGMNSVVAAGAVVVSDVPDNTLVAGVPARIIRQVKI